MEDANFEALEAQFSGGELDRVIEGVRQQADMSVAFHNRLRVGGIGRLSAMVITASMTQAFIVGTLMKPEN